MKGKLYIPTPAQIEHIQLNWRTTRNVVLQRELGLSTRSFYKLAEVAGVNDVPKDLDQHNKHYFTQEQVDYVCKHYHNTNLKKLAAALGISAWDVNTIAKEHDLQHDELFSSRSDIPAEVVKTVIQEYSTCASTKELAERCGLSMTELRSVANRHNLKRAKRWVNTMRTSKLFECTNYTREDIDRFSEYITEHYEFGDTVEIAEHLGLKREQVSRIAQFLDLKKDKSAYHIVKYNYSREEIIEILKKEYSDCVDSHALAERLGMKYETMRSICTQMGLKKSKEAKRQQMKQSIAKRYEYKQQVIQERLRILQAEYPTCEDANELANRLGMHLKTMRSMANKHGIKRLDSKIPKEPKEPNPKKPKVPKEPKKPKPQKPKVTKEPKETKVPNEPKKEVVTPLYASNFRKTKEAQEVIKDSGTKYLRSDVVRVRIRGRQSVQGDFTPDRELLRVLRSEKVQINNGECIGKACYCAAYCGGLAGKFPKHCVTK